MGFGLIFAGYITLLFFKTMPPAMAVGAYLMHKGLTKLGIYGKSFMRAAGMAAALGVYYLAYCGIWIIRFTGIGHGVFTSSIFVMFDDIIYYTMLLVFHIFLYKALEEISRETGYIKGIKRAYMSRVLLAMFYAFAVINIPLGYFKVASYIPLACVLCQFSMVLYTAVFISSPAKRVMVVV